MVMVEVVLAMPLILVVEKVVDVLLVKVFMATMVAMVVTHESVLILTRRTTSLISVGIFMVIPLPIRLCLFQKRSIIDC